MAEAQRRREDFGAKPISPEDFGAVKIESKVSAGAEPFTEGAVEEVVQSAKDFVSQREKGIDYYSGVDQAMFRAGFSRMSNDAEKETFLAEKVGKGNYGKDTYGAWFIAPSGLKKLGIKSEHPVSIDEQRISKYDVADWAGDVPAIAGATALGSMTGGLGAVGMAALGGAGGKAYDEILKIFQGYNKKGPGEMTTTLAKEGASAAIGEGIFRAGARVLKGHSPRNSPERKELTREALDAGLRPKTYQFLDEGAAPILKRFQGMSEKVLGDPSQAGNREQLLRMESGIKARAGQPESGDFVTPRGVEPVLAPPVEDVGGRLIAGVKNKVESDTMQLDYIKNKANAQLDQSLKTIQTALGGSDRSAGRAVVESIKAARAQFSDNATELYSKVDEMVGVPFVPTAALKAQAERIGSQLPRTSDGRVVFAKPNEVHPIQDILDLPEYISVSQAQRIRTMLGEGGLSRDIVPGVDKHDLILLKQSSEKMFDDAGGSLGYVQRSAVLGADGKPLSSVKVTGERGQRAIESLREADKFYKDGIRKFDFPTIAAITRDARMSGSVDPEQVINYIIKPGRTSDVERVKRLVGPVWQKVTRAHFDEIVVKSSSLVNGEEQIVGKRLYDNIKNMGRTFDAVYGKEATQIRQYAAELAARDGKIDPALLSKTENVSSGLAADLQLIVSKQKELDAFLKDNYLAALGRPGKESEQAVDFIFRPDSPQRVLEAKRFYGENSQEFMGLQQQAMQKVLSSFVERTDDPLVKVLNGRQLKAELDRYGKKTLEATFGKDLSSDLYKFAELSEFITKKGPVGAGGIVAANVALHPVKNIGKMVDLFVMGRLMRTPGFVKWLSEGIDANTPPKKAAAALARVSALTAAMAEDETGSATVHLPVTPEQGQ